MEAVIITVITVAGSVLTSIISLIINKKIRQKKEKKATEAIMIDLKNHPVFSVIDNLIKNEINLCNFSDYKCIKKFLIKRLELTKKNLLDLIEYDIKSLTLYKCKKLISDFMNGLNGFNDVEIISNYNHIIHQKILDNFNRINYSTTLIILNYIDSIQTQNNYEVFNHFFNLYVSFLKSLITHVCFNIDFLVNNDVNDAQLSHANATQIIQKQLQNTMETIEKNSHLDQYIDEIVQKNVYINRDKFLFYLGFDAAIIYCSNYCTHVLKYPIHGIIGCSLLSLIDFNSIENLQKYLDNPSKKKSTCNVQILDQEEKPHSAVICKYSVASDTIKNNQNAQNSHGNGYIYLCFKL